MGHGRSHDRSQLTVWNLTTTREHVISEPFECQYRYVPASLSLKTSSR